MMHHIPEPVINAFAVFGFICAFFFFLGIILVALAMMFAPEMPEPRAMDGYRRMEPMERNPWKKVQHD